MLAVADLEITLHRREASSYEIELRFSQPNSDADDRLLPDGPTLFQFDPAQFRDLVLNDAAYGRLLTKSLFGAAMRTAFACARASAQAVNAPLRVRLIIGPSAPELHQLRWETLRDPQDDSPLLTGENLLFSRYLSSLDGRPVGVRPKGNLRVLAAVANPSDLATYRLASVDVADELARIKAALGTMAVTSLADRGQVTLERMTTLLRDGYDILYLVCHGALKQGEPKLYLEAPNGATDVAPGEDLVARLRELRERPRLVVLASCQSAGTGEQDLAAAATTVGALAALGPRLAAAGIPAVLAMQGSITSQTLSQFMPVFFAELLRDGQIDRAVAVARGAVRDRPDSWVPVLFLRLKSGSLWYVPGFAGDRPDFEQWPGVLRSIDQGRCTPILGPGLLESLLGPTSEIARRWAEKHHFPMAPHSRDDLPQVAQFLKVNQYPEFPRDELRDYLRRELLARFGDVLPAELHQAPIVQLFDAAGKVRHDRDPAEPHRVLAQLECPLYLTTNSDSLLEGALSAAGKTPQVVLCPWNEYVERANQGDSQPPDSRHPLVYHLFGLLSQPDSLVLTEDDYFDYLIGVTTNKDLIPEVVRRALADTALLFLGFQMDDWNFRVLFRSIMNREGGSRRRRYSHVAAQINPEEGRFLEPERARRYLESYFQHDDIRIYWGGAEDLVRDLLAYRSAAVPAGATGR